MTQLGFFDPPPVDDPWGGLFEGPIAEPSRAPVARYYQDECDAALDAGFVDHNSQLVLMATGTGKSVVISLRIKKVFDAGGAVLVMAHRNELVNQMARHIERATGEYVEIEQADLRVSSKARLVVASTQSLSQVRLERLGNKRFDLAVCDEAHNYLAPGYRAAYEFFRCKKFGVTATADRTDERALEQIFEHVAYVFDITDGIDAGYLVPVLGQSVDLKEIDLSEVKSTGKDLVVAQLDEVMLKAGDGFVQKVLELAPDRRGPLFLPGVKSADYVARRFNALRPNSCGFVSANDSWSPLWDPETIRDKGERRKRVLADALEGRIPYLANCAVLTEGFDWPSANLVGMGRQTESRQLYAQCAGRGTRVLPGVVDHIHGKAGSDARRGAIAASSKPDMLLLDFGGNSGRHSLVGPADILGGNYTEAEVAAAKKAAKNGEAGDIRELLERVRRTMRQAAERAASKVKAQVTGFDPFKSLGVPTEDRYQQRFGRQPLTEAQFNRLVRDGLLESEAAAMSKREASRTIDELFARKTKSLAEPAQLRALAQYGIVDSNLTKDRAIVVLEYLFRNKNRIDMAKVRELINA